MGGGNFKAVYPKRCADMVPGETHAWEMVEHRSPESHKHYFAQVADAWANLPEHMADELPSPEHLRKYALIKAGYCDMTKIVCKTNYDAMTTAGLMRGMDSYALFEITGNVLTVWRAHSQSMRSMGKARFQASKEAVLAVISQLIGADAAQAGMAA